MDIHIQLNSSPIKFKRQNPIGIGCDPIHSQEYTCGYLTSGGNWVQSNAEAKRCSPCFCASSVVAKLLVHWYLCCATGVLITSGNGFSWMYKCLQSVSATLELDKVSWGILLLLWPWGKWSVWLFLTPLLTAIVLVVLFPWSHTVAVVRPLSGVWGRYVFAPCHPYAGVWKPNSALVPFASVEPNPQSFDAVQNPEFLPWHLHIG